MRYLHIGIENTSNIGDEAITLCIRQDLKRHHIDFITHSFNFSDGNTSVNTKLRASKSYSILKRIKFIKALYDLVFIPLKNYNSIQSFIKKAKNVDSVLIGGGNLLMGLDLVFPIQVYIYTAISRLLKKRVYILFVGYGPFNNFLSKYLIDHSIKMSHKVIFRDSITFKSNKNIQNTAVICDPVIFISNLIQNKAIEKSTTYDIGISVLAYLDPKIFAEGDEESHQLFIKKFADLINKLALENKILLFTTDEKADRPTLEELYKLTDSPSISIKHPHSVNELAALTIDCKMILSTRMHSAIFALSYNVPVIALSWQKKVTALLNDLGLNKYLFDINNIENDQTDILSLVDKLTNDELAVIEYKRILMDNKFDKQIKYEQLFSDLKSA